MQTIQLDFNSTTAKLSINVQKLQNLSTTEKKDWKLDLFAHVHVHVLSKRGNEYLHLRHRHAASKKGLSKKKSKYSGLCFYVDKLILKMDCQNIL